MLSPCLRALGYPIQNDFELSDARGARISFRDTLTVLEPSYHTR